MKIPFEVDGKVEKITLKELGARLWPFGEWNIIYYHPTKGEFIDDNYPSSKQTAVAAFHLWKDKAYRKAVRIKKIGGFFNGIEFRPRTEKQNNI